MATKSPQSVRPAGMTDESAERLAAATLDLYHRVMLQPGGAELLEKAKAECRAHGLI